jgi:hypothetical protein
MSLVSPTGWCSKAYLSIVEWGIAVECLKTHQPGGVCIKSEGE